MTKRGLFVNCNVTSTIISQLKCAAENEPPVILVRRREIEQRSGSGKGKPHDSLYWMTAASPLCLSALSPPLSLLLGLPFCPHTFPRSLSASSLTGG